MRRARISGSTIRRVAIFAIGAAAGAATVAWTLLSPRLPSAPPTVELTNADPAVAAAVARAREEVLRDPRSSEAWGRLGMTLLAHDFFVAAAVSLAVAAGLDAKDPRWPYFEGRALLEGQPDVDAALRALERAAAIESRESAPRLLLAETLLENGRLDEADASFAEASRREPASPRMKIGRARIAWARGDLEAARAGLEEALRSAPNVRAARALLAEVLHRSGDADGAERERAAMARLPETHHWPDLYERQLQELRVGVTADTERANGLFVAGRADEAFALLEGSIARQPDALLPRLLLGRLQLQAGRFAESEASLAAACERAPTAFEAWFELGGARERQGKLAAAEEAYRKTLALKPDYPPAQLRLGHCRLQAGDGAAALAAFREALRLKPDYAAAYRDLGQLLLQLGQRDEARELLQQALRLNPGDAAAKRALDALP